MDFTFYVESSQLVRDASYLSVREVSIVSGLSSFASFLNDLIQEENGGTSDVRHWYVGVLKYFYPDFELDHLLVET